MSRGMWIILGVVVLDSIGIGLVWPILPELIRQMSGGREVAAHYGVLSALYALMQFLCAPLLGLLSDRFGRRPVLLVSLAAAAADYALMALTPSMSWLYVGRIVSGMMAANMAVASAYVADVTPPEERGRRFGWVSACFGLGFIAGPALGGWLGVISIRAPFWAAVALNALNFLVALALLPETRPKDERRFDWKGLNPFAPLGRVFRSGDMLPLFLVFALVTMVGQLGGVVWVLYGHDRFGWGTSMTGLSLALYGLFHAIVQGLLTGPVIKRIGERGAFVLSVAIDALAYVGMGLATRGWMVFALIPLFCLGGMEAPALQAILSRNTADDRQGELNGLLAGLGSLAGVASAIGATLVYAATQHTMPGLVWFLGACLFLLTAWPLLAARRRLSLS